MSKELNKDNGFPAAFDMMVPGNLDAHEVSSNYHTHTEVIDEGELPIYQEAAKKVGKGALQGLLTVSVLESGTTLPAQQGKVEVRVSDYRQPLVGTGDFYAKVQELKSEKEV